MAALYDCSDDRSVAVPVKGVCLLFRLPLELRRQIYEYIFGPRRHVQLAYDGHHDCRFLDGDGLAPEENFNLNGTTRWREMSEGEKNIGILEVSRVIRNETLDVLYGRDIFVERILPWSALLFPNLGVASLRRIRYLRIVVQPRNPIGGVRPVSLDPEIWLPLLDGLVQFCIVTRRQPWDRAGYWRGWNTWLDPVLEYLSANLSKTTAVSIDDDGRAETLALVAKHFGPDFKRGRTVTGDFFFAPRWFNPDPKDCELAISIYQ
ncbi:MAG: hypothetical protein LQ350_008619 [Teloschistes chrysophthalmus]|nr:MAG: hypothetical protein LQ350_008619 [Niorma chrysophthalma]